MMIWCLGLLLAMGDATAPPVITVTNGVSTEQVYLRGTTNYVAVGVLSGANGESRSGGIFNKVNLYKLNPGKKSEYSLVDSIDLGYVNGLPVGVGMVAGDIDGDKTQELGVAMRDAGGNPDSELVIYRASSGKLNRLWWLKEGSPQMEDLDMDGRAEVEQFGQWTNNATGKEPVYYLQHIYRFKSGMMTMDDTGSTRIFHTVRERARGDLELILKGKGNADGAFRAAAEFLLAGRVDKEDMATIWKQYQKPLKDRLTGEQWNALQQIKP